MCALALHLGCRRVKAGHATPEQRPCPFLQPQHVAKTIVLAGHIHQVAPAALHRKGFIGQRGPKSSDPFGRLDRQLHETDLAQPSARVRAQNEASIGTDALVGPQRSHAMIIPAHGIGVERQVDDMGNAGVTDNLLGSFRRGTDHAGKQRPSQNARSTLQA